MQHVLSLSKIEFIIKSRNNKHSYLIFQTQTTPDGNNQWFATAQPNNSVYPQDHHSIENPGLQQRQSFNQRPNHKTIAPNFNQLSSAYDMRQSEKLYVDRSSQYFHPPPLENMTSLQSSPYVKQSLAENRFQQPPSMQNAQESYEYQNYGFQPDIHQSMSSGYRYMGLNAPVFTNYEYRRPGGVIHPLYASGEKPGLQRAPQQLPNSELPHSEYNSAFQTRYDTQLYSIPHIVQSSSLSGPGRASQQFSVSKMKIPQIQNQSQLTDTINGDSDAIVKDQTTVIQLASEKIKANGDNEFKPSEADSSQNIPEIDISQNETLGAGLAIPSNGEKWNNQYSHPSTPIAPEIMNKVNFFEEKIIENQPTKSTSYGEEMQRNYIPMSNLSEHFPSSIPKNVSGEPSDIAVYNDFVTAEMSSDNTIKVCYSI